MEPTENKTQTSESGFTLIELVIAIIIFSLIGLTLLLQLTFTLRNSATNDKQAIAVELAQERMDLIFGRKQALGFASFTDPCPGPSLCTPPSGYTVSSSIVANWQSNTNYKEIVVTVSGDGDAVLRAIVGVY